MKAANTLFQFPRHFAASDVDDTIKKCRFRPPIADMPVTALCSEEADIVWQSYQTDAVTFAYVQSDIRKSFDMYTVSARPTAYFRIN